MESNQYPGETWTATAQCQIFLLDNNAHIDHTEKDFQVKKRCVIIHRLLSS